jgi:hypothetical protein
LKENADANIAIMLLGNKLDLAESREVKHEAVEDYINKNRLLYL